MLRQHSLWRIEAFYVPLHIKLGQPTLHISTLKINFSVWVYPHPIFLCIFFVSVRQTRVKSPNKHVAIIATVRIVHSMCTPLPKHTNLLALPHTTTVIVHSTCTPPPNPTTKTQANLPPLLPAKRHTTNLLGNLRPGERKRKGHTFGN